MSRLLERLLLQESHGQGLLLRLYTLKRDLADPNSDLSFLKEKHFASLAKDLSSAKALWTHSPSSRQAEEMSKTRSKLQKHLKLHFETLSDVTEAAAEMLATMEDIAAASLALDAAKATEITARFVSFNLGLNVTLRVF